MNKLISLRYPIGKFEYGKSYTLIETRKQIDVLEDLPTILKKIMKKMTRQHLDTPYRTGGWTVRQVIHHLGDSHLNAYIRMKLALTEENPVIKPYKEDAWVSLASEQNASVKDSLRLLKALHTRWVELMKTFTASDLNRTYFHPDLDRAVSLAEAIALYAWHTQHHLAHIRLVTEAERTKEKEAAKSDKKEKAEKKSPTKPVLERVPSPAVKPKQAQEEPAKTPHEAGNPAKPTRQRTTTARKKTTEPTVAVPDTPENTAAAKPAPTRKPRPKAAPSEKPRTSRARKPVTPVSTTTPAEDNGIAPENGNKEEK